MKQWLIPSEYEQKQVLAGDPGTNLVYLEADANYTWLHSKDRSRLLTARTLKYHQDKLPVDVFVRLNRNILVNRRYIERIERVNEGYKIYLSLDRAFIVSRRRWQNVRQQLLNPLTLGAQIGNVLLIEDNLDQHLIMKYVLQKHIPDVSPINTNTADEATTYLDLCLETKLPLPHLILLDLYLPKREDGWNFLQFLRRHPIYKDIPVIIISYSNDQRDIEESYYWGANSFITKPSYGQEWSEHFQVLSRFWNPANNAIE